MRFSNCKIFVIVLALVLSIASSYAAVAPCPSENALSGLSPEKIVGFMDCFTSNVFEGSLWAENTLQILFLVFLPLFLVFVILYAVLSEIEFFEDKKINILIALLLALISFPTGIVTGLVFFLASVGTTMAVLVVFGALFGLGLSYYFRKKAEQYDFFMGSRILTIYLTHLPLLVVFVLAGVILGGMSSFSGGYFFSDFFITGFIDLPYLLLLLALVSLILLFIHHKNEKLAMLFLAGISISLVLAPLFLDDLLARSQITGAAIGLIITNFYVVLEKGRKYGLRTIAMEGAERINYLAQEESYLSHAVDKLTQLMRMVAAKGGKDKLKENIKYRDAIIFKKDQEVDVEAVEDRKRYYESLLKTLKDRIEEEKKLHRAKYISEMWSKKK